MIWGLLEHVQMSSSARLGDWPPEEGSGGVLLFRHRTPKRYLLSNYPSDRNRIWFDASRQRDLVILCSNFLMRPSEAGGAGGDIVFRIRHYL